jgi:hypothetical protein
MTGMICGQAKNCKFYKAEYGTVNFNNPVITSGKTYACDVITNFFRQASEGPARLSAKSLILLMNSPLECEVISGMNKSSE